jgi:hypothetical protein
LYIYANFTFKEVHASEKVPFTLTPQESPS